MTLVVRGIPEKTIAVGKPAVLRLVPGLNNDNPIVVTFDSDDDAMLYWKADDVFDGLLLDSGEGYNHLHLDGKIDITSFSHVDIKHMTHEQVQDFADRIYRNWAMGNNWLRLDESTYRLVCGDEYYDKLYCKWVEKTLGILHDED